MSLKTLREELCRRAGGDWPREVTVAIEDLIRLIDFHRPLGTDGKHGNRHTPTCGCEDR